MYNIVQQQHHQAERKEKKVGDLLEIFIVAKFCDLACRWKNSPQFLTPTPVSRRSWPERKPDIFIWLSHTLTSTHLISTL